MPGLNQSQFGPAHRARHMDGALAYWAQLVPEKRAYVFVDDQGREARSISYAELTAAVSQFSARLGSVARAGDRALLIFPSCLEFVVAFLACLRTGVIAVPISPPRRNRYSLVASAIAEDSRPTVILSISSEAAIVSAELAALPSLSHVPWLLVDDAAPPDALDSLASWTAPEPDQLAFLQYTSGSTSMPKGVMVSHGNLIANEEMIYRGFEHDSESLVVGWAPFFHDQGLIGNLLHPLYAGATCVLMSPVSFLKRPLLWLKMISKYRAHTSGGPNFAYDYCCRAAEGKPLEDLDLSCWKVAFNGAEPVRAETLRQFHRTFGSRGFALEAFYPCYGMAESTLFVTGARKGTPPVSRDVSKQALLQGELRVPDNDEDSKTLVGCGVARFGEDVAIVDPETCLELPPDREGEIWVAGANIARGYWHQPELSEATFAARIVGSTRGPFLRTGDRGFLSTTGELFITGRIKDMIIVLGRNHYPQDIETTVEAAHGCLRPNATAAFSIESHQGEQLVIVQEIQREQSRHFPEQEVASAVRREVAREHQLTIHDLVLVRAGTIPKTTSGKVQRRLTRSLYLECKIERLIPVNDVRVA